MPKRAANPEPLALPQWRDVRAATTPTDAASALWSVVTGACQSLGFSLAGICSADPCGEADLYRDWIAAGKHGSMTWLADQARTKADARVELPTAKSIIMVADRYAPRGPREPGPAPTHGAIAKYARGRDYHLVIKNRLHRLSDALRLHFKAAPPAVGAAQPDGQPHDFRTFVDTAPIHERAYAQLAGLGWRGKNTLLINPEHGSFLLLGGILTTLDLFPGPLAPHVPKLVVDHCGTCTRCIDACPTQAITPYSVDARRCIAYLTIEHQGEIDPALHHGIGRWIFGCDICQDVCPHNSPRPGGGLATEPNPINPEYTPRHSSFDLLEVLGWDEPAKRRAAEGTPVKWASLEMLKRNALIAARNALDDPTTRLAMTQQQAEDLTAAVQRHTS